MEKVFSNFHPHQKIQKKIRLKKLTHAWENNLVRVFDNLDCMKSEIFLTFLVQLDKKLSLNKCDMFLSKKNRLKKQFIKNLEIRSTL